MAQRQFSGEPKTRWLTEPGADRDMIVTEAFWFRDSVGKQWDAPANSEIDGASIPKFLWSTIGSPYTGDYRRASIVHDVACDHAAGDHAARKAADRMFFEACRAGGCSKWEATVLYLGVRIGAWVHTAALDDDEVIRLAEPIDFAVHRQDFQTVCEDVLRQGETDDPDELELRADAAFLGLAARKAAIARAVGVLPDA